VARAAEAAWIAAVVRLTSLRLSIYRALALPCWKGRPCEYAMAILFLDLGPCDIRLISCAADNDNRSWL